MKNLNIFFTLMVFEVLGRFRLLGGWLFSMFS
jgi:hypothetical protein